MPRGFESQAEGTNGLSIEDALMVERPQMGMTTSVMSYRLVRLVLLEEILGRGGARTSYVAGKRLGTSLAPPDLDAFIAMFRDLGFGRVEIAKQGPHSMLIDLFECVTCSGISPVGRTLCTFEAGLIAGIIERIRGTRAKATEVKCIGGLGHDRCRFEVALE